MLISLRHKFIFVANEKTGSTSLEAALCNYSDINIVRTEWGKHSHLAAIERQFGWIFDVIPKEEFLIFGVVREPFDWLASQYHSHQDQKFARYGHEYAGDMTSDEFIEIWCDRNPKSSVPQNQRFLSATGEIGTNFLIKFENMNEQFDLVARYLELPQIFLPRINASPQHARPFNPGPASLRLIRERYALDYGLHHSAGRFVGSAETRGALAQQAAPRPVSQGSSPPRLSEDEVVWGYRIILGRDPESRRVVEEHRAHASLEVLRNVLLASREYRMRKVGKDAPQG